MDFRNSSDSFSRSRKRNRESITAEKDVRELTDSQNDVSLTLAKHLLSTAAKGSNSIFSPLSLQVVLGLIAAGSSGPTMAQILSFLKSGSVDDLNRLYSQVVAGALADGSASGGPRMSFANGVWIDHSLSFKPSFKKVVDDVYEANSQEVDFQNKADQVCEKVNAWAEKETKGLIKEVLSPGSIGSSARLILANALYFKGEWDKKFYASETRVLDFHLLNGSTIKAPFMTSEREQFMNAYDGFKVLRLPYRQSRDKNRRFSMYFYLPHARNGLLALVEKLGSKPGFLDHHLPTKMKELEDFRIPKFKISFGFEASKTLKELGLMLPFSGEGLDGIALSEIAESENLAVSSIFHKAFVEVNEEGTEAVAVTAFCCSRFRCREEIRKPSFVADHPFLFVIREDYTGVVLFIGSVVNPTPTLS